MIYAIFQMINNAFQVLSFCVFVFVIIIDLKLDVHRPTMSYYEVCVVVNYGTINFKKLAGHVEATTIFIDLNIDYDMKTNKYRNQKNPYPCGAEINSQTFQ